MKISIALILLLILGALAGLAGCKSGGAAIPQSQTATAKKGNLTVAITANGNLSLSNVQNLSFQTSGTVTDVLVQLGDSVAKGQELARLDTTAYNDQITTLQDQLTTKQNSLTAAQHQLVAKQNGVTAARHQLAARQNALTAAQHQLQTKQDAAIQSQINLETAQYNLNVINDVSAANAQLTKDQTQLQIDTTNMEEAVLEGFDPTPYLQRIKTDNLLIAQDKQNLSQVLSGHSTTLSPDVNTDIQIKTLALQSAQAAVNEGQNSIEEAQAAITDAQNAVDDATTAIADAQNAVEEAQTAVDGAQTGVNEAQTSLDQARAETPSIIAPFAGFISLVNVAQGDQIANGKVAVQLSDPTQFEVGVLVSERDVFNVVIGGTATVQMDALSGVTLPGKVAKISQTATVQSGVVNYLVTVQVTSLQNVGSSVRGTGGQRPATTGTATTTPARTSPTTSAPRTSTAPPATTTSPAATTPAAAPVQLKAGLTATTNIIVTQRNNVLLVPTLAIIAQTNGEFVQVLKNGVVTQQQVQIGASDFQSAEVISGLNDGDVVVIPQNTTGSSTNRGPSFLPGLRIGG